MTTDRVPDTLRRATVLAIVATLYGAVVAALAGPGFASFDTAYQWWMGRHSVFSTLWPPSYLVTFSAFGSFSPLIEAPTVWFLLNVALVSASAAVIAFFCARTHVGGVATFFALAASPVVWLLLPHVWSDVGLVAMLLFAVASLCAETAYYEDTPSRSIAHWACFICLFVAVGIRHNALLAVAPLLFAWVMLAIPQVRRMASCARRHVTAVLISTFLTVTFFAVHSGIAKRLAVERSDTWAITAIWDLQAISVATGRVQIPLSISPDTDLTDLRTSFDPVNAVTLYGKSRAHWANATTGLSNHQSSDLIAAWRSAVQSAPREYFAHRWFVIMAMMGVSQRNDVIDRTIHGGTRIEPIHTQFRDNPRQAFWWGAGFASWRRISDELLNTRAGTPLTTLLAALIVSAACLFRRWPRPLSAPHTTEAYSKTPNQPPSLRPNGPADSPGRGLLAAASLTSGALYLAGIFVAAPTADMRYILWPVIASVLTAVFTSTMRSPCRTPDSSPVTSNPAS